MSTHTPTPLPVRYDPVMRNIISQDGAILCRVGDSVYADPEIATFIVRACNAHEALVEAVRMGFEAIDSIKRSVDDTEWQESWQPLHNGYKVLQAALARAKEGTI